MTSLGTKNIVKGNGRQKDKRRKSWEKESYFMEWAAPKI